MNFLSCFLWSEGCDYKNGHLVVYLEFLSSPFPSSCMTTFASLRTLHALIGDALDDVERIFVSRQPSVYSSAGSDSSGDARYSSSQRTLEDEEANRAPLDFPSLDEPYDPLSPAEALLSHPAVVHATKLIVSATGQLAATVQRPFLTICDATMGVRGPIYLQR